MPRRGDGLAGRCRMAWQEFDGQWTSDHLGDAVGVSTYGDKKRLSTVLRDAMRRGEIERVGPGVFRTLVRETPPPAGRDRMWRVVRMRRTVSVDDLAEIAGVSRAYAQEYLKGLVKLDVLEPLRGKRGEPARYRLIQDALCPPENGDKAERLRALRARHKALAMLDKAMESLAAARTCLLACEAEPTEACE